MKTIVVPTDFSDNAENALTYACEFNRKLNAKIHLLHSYHLPLPASDGPVVPISPKEMENIAINGLNRTKNKFELIFPGTQFETEATLGMASDEIESYAKKLNSDLIIMGTHGASGLKEFLIGTNAAAVMERASCPVLTVPEKAIFGGIKTMVFAADYGKHNYSHVIKLVEIAKIFDAEIILLHISSGEMEDTMEDLEIGQFKERVTRDSNYSKISYRLIEDKDVFHGMNTYIEQNKPDLLAISMRHRSFIEKIFSRSLTKRMAYHSDVPVLSMHII